ncbi:uncharacterized protein TNIN_159991 [Trichonephila inaurata madagascariensis]|uniref:Uncharacterized protein n=1 Tax=Trichonephila inaurata madagascariensis TaxID=2747483 RepID=A0A8X7CS11_9ARAC|nr:uncharacterized protein TNIN_159991 [Trichonephila inaurata madagascariensis]
MKKASVYKGNKKTQTSKQFNMKLDQGDDINKPHLLSDSDCVVESQAETYLQESNKQHPSMVAEGERMVKKLADCHNEIKSMKIEIKRKQTTIDLLRSEKDRNQRNTDELGEKFRKEKCKLLEEILTLQKERDTLHEANVTNEASLQEITQEHRTLQEDFDSLEVKLQQTEREHQQDKEILQGLIESKEKLQKDLFEAKMVIEAKSSMENNESLKELKIKIEKLYEEIETLKRSRDHEHLLKERLSQDNLELIKRHSDIESELAEAKALLREEESKLASLEQVHLNTILEASEAKSKDQSLKEEIEHLNRLLKEEKEYSYTLSQQLSDEKRFKTREEEKMLHLQERFNQKEESMKMLKNENIILSRDNTYFKDEVLNVKQQLQTKDQEVLNLKHKVQEMQISVEEFIQSSQAATRLAGERWKQLGQLAQSIQALTCMDD